MLERYTSEAKAALIRAKEEAFHQGAAEITLEHLLLALVNDDALVRSVMDYDVCRRVRRELAPNNNPQNLSAGSGDLPMASSTLRALNFARAEAPNGNYVTNLHVLLGIVNERDSTAAVILERSGLNLQRIRSIGGSPIQTYGKRQWVGWMRSLFRRLTIPSRDNGLTRVLELAAKGRSRDALRLIAELLAVADDDRQGSIKRFAPHAMAIAYASGDLTTARRYCEMLLGCDPDSPLALYGMADIHAQAGELVAARRYAQECRRVAKSQGNPDNQGIIELIDKRFPELDR